LSFHVTPTEAAWFLPLILPICLWAAISDLRRMIIPNRAVLSLAFIFLSVGLFLMPLDAYGIRLLQLGVVLVLGFGITQIGLAGAGDSKLAAAIALYVAPGDYLFFLQLFAIVTIVSWLAHRTAGKIPVLRRALPGWSSWNNDKLFPMGIALSGSLIVYFCLALLLAD